MYDLHLTFTLGVWLLCAGAFLRSRCASTFHPIFFYLMFHGLVFVIRPFFQYYLELNHVYKLYGFWPTEDVKHATLFAANLGLICFFFGAMSVGNLKMRFWSSDQTRFQNRYGQQLLTGLVISFPLIVFSIRYALSINFGDQDLRNLTRDAATFHTVYTDTSAYLVDANLMLGAFGVAIAWAYRFRPVSLIPFACFVALRLTVGWSRYTFIMTSMGLALLFLFEQRRKWIKPWMFGAGVGLLIIFSALSSQRALVADWIKGEESKATHYNQARRSFFDNLDFANLEFVEYLIRIIPDQTHTYNYFSNSLEVLTAPIPRIFWPGKPVGPPLKFFNINDYGFPVGITFTLVGEGWQSLGYLGVIVWCTLAGVLWGGAYRVFVTRNASTFVTLYYCICLPLCLQWFRDGLLLSMIKFPLFFVTPVALAQLINTLGSRKRFSSKRITAR